jgi:hypothetical protein
MAKTLDDKCSGTPDESLGLGGPRLDRPPASPDLKREVASVNTVVGRENRRRCRWSITTRVDTS